MTTYNFVEGWTNPIDCILNVDGEPLPLSGLTVSLVAYDKDKATLSVAGAVAVVDSPAGKVRYTPTSSDVLMLSANSPVLVRWKLVAGPATWYIPNTPSPDHWVVSKP